MKLTERKLRFIIREELNEMFSAEEVEEHINKLRMKLEDMGLRVQQKGKTSLVVAGRVRLSYNQGEFMMGGGADEGLARQIKKAGKAVGFPVYEKPGRNEPTTRRGEKERYYGDKPGYMI